MYDNLYMDILKANRHKFDLFLSFSDDDFENFEESLISLDYIDDLLNLNINDNNVLDILEISEYYQYNDSENLIKTIQFLILDKKLKIYKHKLKKPLFEKIYTHQYITNINDCLYDGLCCNVYQEPRHLICMIYLTEYKKQIIDKDILVNWILYGKQKYSTIIDDIDKDILTYLSNCKVDINTTLSEYYLDNPSVITILSMAILYDCVNICSFFEQYLINICCTNNYITFINQCIKSISVKCLDYLLTLVKKYDFNIQNVIFSTICSDRIYDLIMINSDNKDTYQNIILTIIEHIPATYLNIDNYIKYIIKNDNYEIFKCIFEKIYHNNLPNNFKLLLDNRSQIEKMYFGLC